ncbi:uncharacterized protein LOC142358469 [Convolutriloba macropyga]|uniref:uncharacterized protein LOC142358469 n=1 Tax=Convolutriloba macropyga TaxID=536237 RepID=UPI003F520072
MPSCSVSQPIRLSRQGCVTLPSNKPGASRRTGTRIASSPCDRWPQVVCSSTKKHESPILSSGKAQHELHTPRRLLLSGLAATLLQANSPSKAEAAGRDLVKAVLRPQALSPEDALVQLLDARGTSLELQMLADTPLDSKERFEARAILPGMATALRKVQDAAPSALTLINDDVEANLGSRYGGNAEAGEKGVLDDVYISIGRVLTLSGRTIRADAIEPGSQLTSKAASSLDSLIALLPADVVETAQERRRARRNKQ